MSRNYFNNGNTYRGKRGKGFYHQIQCTYGFSWVRLLKDWSHIEIDYVKQFNQRVFLLRCRKHTSQLPKIYLELGNSRPLRFYCEAEESYFTVRKSNLQLFSRPRFAQFFPVRDN